MDASSTSEREDQDWKPLLHRIDDDRCLPFLDAGANTGILLPGGGLAARLAQEYGYPPADTNNLEYVALRHGREHVKQELVRILNEGYDVETTATSDQERRPRNQPRVKPFLNCQFPEHYKLNGD